MLLGNKPSILIVDDDLAILRCFTRIFERVGYNVSVASAGKEAIEKLGMERFDVALIDFCLPDMEGTRLFPLISQVSPSTVKVMLTGKALEGCIGADAFVTKPIKPERLLSVIDCKLRDRNIET